MKISNKILCFGAVVILVMISLSTVTGIQTQEGIDNDFIGESKILCFQLKSNIEDLQISFRNDYDFLEIEGYDLDIKEGKPIIPFKNFRYSIPIGYKAADIRVESRKYVKLDDFRLAPVEKPLKLTKKNDEINLVEGDIYKVNSFYPGEIVALGGTGHKSGYPVVDIVFFPIQFNPVTGETIFYKQINIELELEVDKNRMEKINYRNEETENIIRESVKKIVENPDGVPKTAVQKTAGGPSSLQTGNVEYLIITHPNFENYFQILADWKTKKGIPAEVVTTSWIYNNYGTYLDDYQTRIRLCIKDYWMNKGLMYVLLGGDTGYVYSRNAYVMNNDNGNAIPCDLYYADLDGTWNDDEDYHYGEHPDDNIDFLADVYVGRAPVTSTTKADRFVKKILQYEGEESEPNLPTNYQNKMLFLASKADSYTDMSALKDQIDTNFVPSQFTITKLYQKNGNLYPSAALNQINLGKNIINHAGHGDTYSLQMGYSYLTSLSSVTNDPSITGVFYSLSCYSGNFPAGECIGEQFVNAQNGGGAYIGNSRYGWYYQGNPTSGLSSRFDKYFFKGLFQLNHYPLGVAFFEGRESGGLWFVKSDKHERYCYYEQNLLGDPETPIYKNNPQKLTLSHPSTLPSGTSQFTVNVKANSVNVNGATVCLWKDDEVYMVETTNSAGNAVFNPSPSTTGIMYVTATKNDYLPDQSTATVQGEQYTLTVINNGQGYVVKTPDKTTYTYNEPVTLTAFASSGWSFSHWSGDLQSSNNPETIYMTSDKTIYANYVMDPPGTLSADTYIISASNGGTINFYLDAGPSNANRDYLILATESGTTPGYPLPGGYTTLPLNWDSVTDYVLHFLNTQKFIDFYSQLDSNGVANAQMNLDALGPIWAGKQLHFAFCCNNPFDLVSNPVPIDIIQ